MPNYQPIIKLFHFIHSTDVYPFMVGIFHIPSNITRCGGSILSFKYVLTALHCVDNAKRWQSLQVTISIKNFFELIFITETEYLTTEAKPLAPDRGYSMLRPVQQVEPCCTGLIPVSSTFLGQLFLVGLPTPLSRIV